MTPELNILVVDDNEDLAINIRDGLHEKGYRATVALSGAAAMEQCRQHPFDLVLLDYNLPDMDGLQLQEKLAEIVQADYIIITGYASVESAAKAVFRKQIVGYETKPLDLDRLLSFVQQIRDRRQAEAALRRSQDRYQNLYEAITDALFVHELDEEGSMGRFTEVNAVACDRYGYLQGEFLGMTPYQIDAPESTTDVAAILGELARGKSATFEQVHLTKDDRRIPVEIHSKAFHLDGTPSVISLVRDITERKKAEEQRRRMERRIQMLQRLESLGVMAAGIAHDFNNILMVVIGNIEMAMDDAAQLPEAFGSLEESKKAALRAVDLVRQMLAYTGKGGFNAAPIHMNAIVEETVELLKRTISPETQLTTRLNGRNPVIHGDGAQLRQIASNLIANARESLDEEKGGLVAVSTGIETCDADRLKATVPEAWLGYDEPLREGRYARLEVADNGCGMDSDLTKRIFEPFFTTKFQGRGLGLSAVIGMVRAHGGFVQVDSQPGRGTAVRILFPLHQEGLAADAQTAVETAAVARRKTGLVLVVDDEVAVRGLMQQMLDKLGYAVVVAANGAEAIELYYRHAGEIDLILLDLSMPVMGGAAAFQELRRIGCTAPVILASGDSEDRIRQEFAGRGFAGFIQKPFRKAALYELLERAMGEKGEG